MFVTDRDSACSLSHFYASNIYYNDICKNFMVNLRYSCHLSDYKSIVRRKNNTEILSLGRDK